MTEAHAKQLSVVHSKAVVAKFIIQFSLASDFSHIMKSCSEFMTEIIII